MAAANVCISTPEEAVARIAYLASDVIVSVQPSLSQDSAFSAYLKAHAAKGDRGLVARNDGGIPEIITVRYNTDPLLSIFTPVRSGCLVSVTTSSVILLASVSHLCKLVNFPIVLHVSLESLPFPDYSAITAIRNSGWTFLQSQSLQEAQDMAVTAHALAIRSGKGVIHFFDADSCANDNAIAPESLKVLQDLLQLDNVRRFQASSDPDSTIYVDSGRVAVVDENGESRPHGTESTPASGSVNWTTLATTPSENSDESSKVTNTPSTLPSTRTIEIDTPRMGSDLISEYVISIWARFRELTGREYHPFEWTGSATAKTAVFLFGANQNLFVEALNAAKPSDLCTNSGLITARLYKPWLGASLLEAIPASIRRIAVLERISRTTTKWGPILTDVLTSVKSGSTGVDLVVGYRLGYTASDTVARDLRDVLQNLVVEKPLQNLEVGQKHFAEKAKVYGLEKPKLETAYDKILNQLFGERVYIANALGSQHAGVSATIAATPEFGFGSLLARKERRQRFVNEVKKAATSSALSQLLKECLVKWVIVADDAQKAGELAENAIEQLKIDGSPLARELLGCRNFFRKESLWLVGSDAWAYDLGNSGVYHMLTSDENINMLIIDSTPYSKRNAADALRRKKDIGLYAMNFGNAYVASVAVYSSYTQVLQAMAEADRFNGPSVVLAYLPYFGEHDSPFTVLQETKKAVDTGYWPLYRWNPSNEERGEPNFSLESELIKKELREFLARDNHLTQLMRKESMFAASLSQDFGSEMRAQQKRKAREAYQQVLEGLFSARLTILFASDNGNAQSLATRLRARGIARGLKTEVMAMEDYPIEDLPSEENIVFITSTAGQGEFPQNGRAFWDSIKDNTDLDLGNVHFSVFGLGDSQYWPRKQDRVYYNKPSKDLNRRLDALGGRRLADLGLGDEQDPDGHQTGYADWERKIWEALGVSHIEGLPEEPKELTAEDIKLASNYLRGTIIESMNDTTTGSICAPDVPITKFHGAYLQDDRDVRDARKAQGLEPAYGFLVRCRVAGGIVTPTQWLQMDDISTNFGNETIKLTSRQGIQFHGIVKGKVKPTIRAINRVMMTTIGAEGDVNRNVMCSSLPTQSAFQQEVYKYAKEIDDHFLPQTTAYHEIWLTEPDETTLVAGNATQDYEPLYGPAYLPRKFKFAIAVPPYNDTDVFTHDVGLIAIKGDDGHLAGFNILAGGGMGTTHNNKKTYPQLGRMLGFCEVENIVMLCEKMLLIQRDHGDRQNRKHARLKYTIDDMGLDIYRSKVEALWGKTFAPPRPYRFESNIDLFGWQKDDFGMNHFTFFIENGRVEDTADFQMKTGLRELAKIHKGEFRVTANQHLIISHVADEDLPQIKELMRQYKLDNIQFSGLRLSSAACVSFPSCGFAMAESERYLPVLISKLENCLEENGLRQDSIIMRMTGCGNGCSRPWVAEVAFAGKAYGAYNMYLGGGYYGQRLNKLYRSSIKEDEILAIMKPLLKRYALERQQNEHFGDFCIRAGIIKETSGGQDFHSNVAEAESDEE